MPKDLAEFVIIMETLFDEIQSQFGATSSKYMDLMETLLQVHLL